MTMDMLNWNRLSNGQRARWHDVVFYVFDTPTRMTRLRIYREPKAQYGETVWANSDTEHFTLPCDAEFISEAVAKRTAENYLRSEMDARGEAS